MHGRQQPLRGGPPVQRGRLQHRGKLRLCLGKPAQGAQLRSHHIMMARQRGRLSHQRLTMFFDQALPADDAALVAIPGIGARKLEQFGPDVLALVKGRQSS